METESYTPQPFIQSEKQQQSKKKRAESCICILFCWLFSILLWVLLFLTVYTLLNKSKNKRRTNIDYRVLSILVYIIYFILELCSQSNKYLCRKNKETKFQDLLESIFKAKPNVSISCECYHSESEYVSDAEDGHYESTNVTTYSETIPIKYYSCRDVSGLFVLNVNEKNINKKAYIELELNSEINYADTISYKENEIIKEDMKKRNEHRDSCFALRDNRDILGMKKHYFLRLQEKEPKCFNCFWFIFFTILTFAEFYKIYINSLCIFQKFKIRKLISTRYDLSTEEFNEKYDKFNPQINIINQTIPFNQNTFIHVLNENKKPMPTETEILECRIYESKIPKYEIYTEEDIGRAGTIKDISYEDYKEDQVKYNKNSKLEKKANNNNITISLTTLPNDELNDQNHNDNNKLLPET